MSKPFLRYEDAPLLLASEGEDPVLVFANNASLTANQPIDAKKYVEDYQISFARQTGDIYFTGAHESGFLMGPPLGPGTRLPQSIEIIKSGTRISYPSGQKLFVAEDVFPGDYYIKVRSTEATTLRLKEDVENGEIEVYRNYAAQGPVRGNLALTYYMNTGNIDSFFDITGLVDSKAYPRINEGRVTGCLGDYLFDNAYIRDISFSAQPFQIIQTSVNMAVYGNIKYVEGNAKRITDTYTSRDPHCNPSGLRQDQRTVPHAINTKIGGAQDAGINYPLNFSYSIAVNRNPSFTVPVSGDEDPLGEIPTRVTKEAITITARIQGEKLDPYLKITGKRADLTVELSDIGFSKEFTDNNFGLLKKFHLEGNLVYPQPKPALLQDYGVVDEDALSVSEGGFLQGSATIKQAYR